MKEYDLDTGAAVADNILPHGDRFENLPLALIVSSLTNPRKTFNADKLTELAESIKASEVHQPVLVRPLPASRLEETSGYGEARGPRPTHELVSGERRFRASGMAGKATIPALIRNLTDDQVLEIQIVENLQRDDLTELEEAEGYESLMRHNSITADAVGVKIGKSRSYVYGRLKLLDCGPDARQALREGKIDASRGVLIARIPDQKLQATALKEIVSGSYSSGYEPMSVRQAAEHVQKNYMLKLSAARFTITCVDLVPEAGSCETCPKRTGHNPELFDDVKSADVCTDPPCFHKKEDAHAAGVAAVAKAKGQTVIAGKEAQELQGNGYTGKIKGYRRLDSTEDSPTDQPLRKIIGKQMQAEGIEPTKIENPRKKGDLIDALPNDVVLRLLKTVEGQANAAKVVTKEVKAFADEKKQKAEAKAKTQYERDWRVQLVSRTWDRLRKNDIPAHTLDVHRYLALKAANNLSTDQAAQMCELLDLGKVGAVSAVIDHIKQCVDPDNMTLLMVMVRDSDPHDFSYSGKTANEGMHLVAGTVFKDGVQGVINEVQAASHAKFFPELPKAGADLPAARAKESPRGTLSLKVPATPAKRRGKTTPEEAQLGIAFAMQGLAAEPAGRAVKYRGPNGETWSGRGIPPKWLTVLEIDGHNRDEFLVQTSATTDTPPSTLMPTPTPTPAAAAFTIGQRVIVAGEDKIRAGRKQWAGCVGTVKEEVVEEGDASSWIVALDIEFSIDGTRQFLANEIEVMS